MAPGSGQRPKIIKKIQVIKTEGHHGGAWKVAYADFVTAMMAFFLLMWLLNATTEKQRQGLADYFNPTIMQSVRGGADGAFGGDLRDAETNSGKGVGASRDIRGGTARDAEFDAVVRHIQNELTGSGAESMQRVNLLKHVITRMTDEGLVIELTDLVDEPLFVGDSAQPSPALNEISGILASVLNRVRNPLAITGHVRNYPDLLLHSPVWALSDARAHTVRNLLENAGLAQRRVQRVAAFADRRNRSANPMDPANNRIEVILLR